MYSYIIGQVTEINPTGITVENNGLGYLLYVANPYTFELGEERKFFTIQIVREDDISLYGFKAIEERAMFLDLISVKGIGPKTALAILASSQPAEIKNAIVAEDATYLQKFPKIGKKAASQIILDLSNKYEKDETLKVNVAKPVISNNNEEVIEALQALGYNQKDITKQLKLVDASLSTEEKIKTILQQMIGNK